MASLRPRVIECAQFVQMYLTELVFDEEKPAVADVSCVGGWNPSLDMLCVCVVWCMWCGVCVDEGAGGLET
jgi:hypothetical protein